MPTVAICDTRDWRNANNLAGSSEHVTLVPLWAFLENDVHFQTPTPTKHITVPSWRYEVTVYDIDFVFSISSPQIQLSLFDSLISPPPANLPSESAPIFQLSQHFPSLARRPFAGAVHAHVFRSPVRHHHPSKYGSHARRHPPKRHFTISSANLRHTFMPVGSSLPIRSCELLTRSVCVLENVPWHPQLGTRASANRCQCLCRAARTSAWSREGGMGRGMLTARSLILPACCGISLGDMGMCFISVLQRSGLDGELSTTSDREE